MSPRSDCSWFVRAHVRARLGGNVEGARKDVRRIVQLNPGYVLGMEASGITELVAENWSAALGFLAEAVERSVDDPFLPYRLYPLAIAQAMAGDSQSALAAITEATELRPDCRHYWLVKAWIQREAGREPEAQEAREVAANLVERADILAQDLGLSLGLRDRIGLPVQPFQPEAQ